MRYLFLVLLLFIPFKVLADQDKPRPLPSCGKQIPYGMPETKKELVIICRTAYLVGNDTEAKIPAWVAYELTPKHALGCLPRSNAFASDKSLDPEHRSDPKDYVGTGYDIGHMAPDGDMSWSDTTERESFILSNMSPQLPGLNRGIWKLLETAVRTWSAGDKKNLIVYVGPIYNNKDKTIGEGKVTVPHAFYKIIIDENSGEVLAFIFPQKEALGNDLSKFQTTVKDIENETDITFKLPKGANKTIKTKLWDYSVKALLNDKKDACKLN